MNKLIIILLLCTLIIDKNAYSKTSEETNTTYVESSIKMLREINKDMETIYGWNAIQEHPINYFLGKNIGSSPTTVVTKKLGIVVRVLMLFILLILFANDIKTYITWNSNESEEKDSNTILKYVYKYLIFIFLFFLPNIFTASIVITSKVISTPTKYVFSGTNENSIKNVEELMEIYNNTIDDIYLLKTKNELDILNIDEAISSEIDKIMSNIYFNFIEILVLLQSVMSFILTFFSNFLTMVIAILFPLVVLFNYIPGFEGGIISAYKYAFTFSLWGLIARVIDSMSQSIGIATDMARIQALLDIDARTMEANIEIIEIIDNSMSFSKIILIIMLIILKAVTPKISDILISGSQSGGFFSAITGTAAVGITSVINSLNRSGKFSRSGFNQIKNLKNKMNSNSSNSTSASSSNSSSSESAGKYN